MTLFDWLYNTTSFTNSLLSHGILWRNFILKWLKNVTSHFGWPHPPICHFVTLSRISWTNGLWKQFCWSKSTNPTKPSYFFPRRSPQKIYFKKGFSNDRFSQKSNSFFRVLQIWTNLSYLPSEVKNLYNWSWFENKHRFL